MTEWMKKKMFYVTRWKLNAVNVILILFTKFPSVCSHNALEICSVDVKFKRHENLFFIYISKDIKCKIFGYMKILFSCCEHDIAEMEKYLE